ncbi:MAG: 16S rRNA (uracil(1498)-N(3))-methyltransferase [Bacteroidia bacterium]|jgi:16S rRNA (uracil1498-N3)-methyltransferase|nr:16S rRNA (uracil(1498)-N(3))-methyltransferase [Bacteroidia bacterium]
MVVFFQQELTAGFITLSEEESKHCIRVLRMQVGDNVHLTNGKGLVATAAIADAHPKKCVLKVISLEQKEHNRSYQFHLYIAPAKNNERNEWLIEKAVEAGIDSITWIETQRSERIKIPMERFQKVAIAAMKQSKQWYLPSLKGVTQLDNAFQEAATAHAALIAWCETTPENWIGNQLQKGSQHIAIIIGPEGDFTQAEIDKAKSVGIKPIWLGNSILRTETAGLFACMAVKTICS